MNRTKRWIKQHHAAILATTVVLQNLHVLSSGWAGVVNGIVAAFGN